SDEVWRLQIISRTTQGVEYCLGRIEEAEHIWPAVEVRRAIGVGLSDLQPVRRIVGRASAALVLSVLGDEEPAHQRVVYGREPDSKGVAVAPGEGLDS